MSELARLSFSLEQCLLDKLENLVETKGYSNRSEFIRDLIRSRLVEEEWEGNEEALGTITLIYDHHSRQLSDKLHEVQHAYHHHILATTHVHLDRHLCAEMIMAKGPAEQIRQLANQLQQLKGVLHASLAMASSGHKLS